MALKAQFEVQMQEYETQARIIRSDADAEASKLISEAI
jgi:F0F1-type ATP synthase membrane subunit b/b'